MSVQIADVWASLKATPNIAAILFTFAGAVTTLIGALVVALINARVSIRNTRATLAQAKEALDVQRLASNRVAASFIAQRRQEWIDKLREDISTYLAQSQEIIWKWAAVRSAVADLVNDERLGDEVRQDKVIFLISQFSKENGEHDRNHQERHFRLRFRLNPKERLHIELRNNIDEIRRIVSEVNPNSSSPDDQRQNIITIKSLLSHSDELATAILKDEWTRVKQEVAFPEVMISRIPPPES